MAFEKDGERDVFAEVEVVDGVTLDGNLQTRSDGSVILLGFAVDTTSDGTTIDGQTISVESGPATGSRVRPEMPDFEKSGSLATSAALDLAGTKDGTSHVSTTLDWTDAHGVHHEDTLKFEVTHKGHNWGLKSADGHPSEEVISDKGWTLD